MRILIALLVTGALVAAAFCGWGLFTEAGRRRYEEMDGMIPFFAGCASGAALVLAAVLAIVRRLGR